MQVCTFVLCLLAMVLLTGCQTDHYSNSSAITFITDPGAKSYDIALKVAKEYEAETGQEIRLIRGPADSTERLSQYLQYLGAQSPDIDVYQIDVIWPATLENHLVDLSESFSTTETVAYLPALIKNNTVEGRLLAIPWYLDIGLLYYRTDLLEKYGIGAPPATWDELTTMADTILAEERKAGNATLWGYVFQGRAYEGLTCNALEWQMAEAGGSIVNSVGRPVVSTPGAIKAFDRAASWVGTISPPGVTMYAEEEARQMFQTGNAVFMRNWPYAFSLVNSEKSQVAGKVKTAPLPAGAGKSATTLGGWQLAVSKYSRNQKAATDFVRYMASPYVQKEQALGSSRLPTLTALYDDPDIAKAFPFIPTMRNALDTAVARPSNAARADYNEVSTYYFQHVHAVLTGQATAAQSMAALEELLNKVLKK